jgi:hypothetical protein
MKTTETVRAKLEEAAAASGRSLTAETEHRLAMSFEWDEAWGDVQKLRAEFKRRLEEIESGNLEAVMRRKGWKPLGGTPYWHPPGVVEQSGFVDPAKDARPVATVDLRALIEETIERVLERLSEPPDDDFKHQARRDRKPPHRAQPK